MPLMPPHACLQSPAKAPFIKVMTPLNTSLIFSQIPETLFKNVFKTLPKTPKLSDQSFLKMFFTKFEKGWRILVFTFAKTVFAFSLKSDAVFWQLFQTFFQLSVNPSFSHSTRLLNFCLTAVSLSLTAFWIAFMAFFTLVLNVLNAFTAPSRS